MAFLAMIPELLAAGGEAAAVGGEAAAAGAAEAGGAAAEGGSAASRGGLKNILKNTAKGQSNGTINAQGMPNDQDNSGAQMSGVSQGDLNNSLSRTAQFEIGRS
jgi:hypothetical protein